ncbi:MAG TPA: universal stress protein [Bacteroidota bacterium]|nr:universal stress protein [Bacteroidota bacterium]
MKAPKKILIPVDLSSYSLVAVQYGQEIAALFDAEIVLLHVDEHDRKKQESTPTAAWHDTRRKELVGVVQRLLINHNLVQRSMKIEVRFGSPVREIIHAAEELQADLIVMSTHGRTGLRHVLMGSVAEKVVRFAKCPVLSVKPEEVRELIDITEEDVVLSLHLQGESAEQNP